MTELRTERLTLRRARESDLHDMHDIFADPAAMRYWATVPHESLAVTRAWLAGMLNADLEQSDDFIIEMGGRAIGKMGFWKGNEIGYILSPAVWGKGVAREAIRATLAHGFDTRRFETVTADVDPRNEASIGLLKRMGFVETGFAKDAWFIGGVYSDSVYFALAKDDWRALTAS